MTLHPAPAAPRALAPLQGKRPTEVPGLAYYMAAASTARQTRPDDGLSPELQALEVHYGYYTPQD